MRAVTCKENTWCCNVSPIQAFQTKSPQFPKPPALGKLSLMGDLRGTRWQGDPKVARQPSAQGCGRGEQHRADTFPTPGHSVGSAVGFHQRPSESHRHGHKLTLKCHCGFHLQKYSQPKGTSPSNVPRGRSWNGGCQGCKRCPLCRCHPAAVTPCFRPAPFPQPPGRHAGHRRGPAPFPRGGPNPNTTPANGAFTAQDQEATKR